jgi:mediator of RNA polymerase II transcription subunit 23
MVIHERVAETLQLPFLNSPSASANPFHMLNFNSSHNVIGEFSCSYVLAMCHAVWQHASIGQLSILPV